MIFSERVKSIKVSDKVLEIGPGGLPHPRADVFLEKKYENAQEFAAQRGHHPELKTQKPIVFFDGGDFPFEDKSFDYVICSQVIEHVPDIEAFIKEMTRVEKAGYIEFPTIYYDYLYNYPEHISVPFWKDETIFWTKKSETALHQFQQIQHLFLESQFKRQNYINVQLKNFFFQGFEWENELKTQYVTDLDQLTFTSSEINNLLLPAPENSILQAAKQLAWLVKKKVIG